MIGLLPDASVEGVDESARVQDDQGNSADAAAPSVAHAQPGSFIDNCNSRTKPYCALKVVV